MLKMLAMTYMKNYEELTAIQLSMQLRKSSRSCGKSTMSTIRRSWRDQKRTLSFKTSQGCEFGKI